MYQPELVEIAESLTALMPRLMRGLTSSENVTPREKDLADELPVAQLRLCGILCEGPRAMSALSRELGVSLSALTQIADRLERAKLVKRTAAEDDRRVRCLQLTPRGTAMMRKRREKRLRQSVAILEQLSAPERELVRTAMETLVTACARVPCGVSDARPRDAAGNGSSAQKNALVGS
jgi:DNA-binding MarR family transcriptional regulator